MRGRVLQDERRNARHDLRLYPELAMRAFGLAGLRLRRRAPSKVSSPLRGAAESPSSSLGAAPGALKAESMAFLLKRGCALPESSPPSFPRRKGTGAGAKGPNAEFSPERTRCPALYPARSIPAMTGP